ncbi:MAG: hypothetical protein J6S11_06300 [Bacteroidaceae bacterium]|nr:hypothetical protein [Bacteroidaceae bacterium]
MKKDFFKSIACGILMMFSLTSVQAQSIKESFSAEGRKNWKSEVTVRGNLGIYAGGFAVTGGVRIDEKRTLGLMAGKNVNVYTITPGYTDVNSFSAALYGRRYFHLGERKIFSLYSDLALGAAVVTDIEGAYWVDPDPIDGTTKMDDISVENGDVQFYLSWQPGVRVRFFDNVHLFLGPTLSSHCLGVHLGIGF